MRKNNDQPLKEVLKEFVEQKKFKDKLSAKKLESLWQELFGSLAGSYTERIHFHKGILTIYLSSSTLRKELSLNKNLILTQMNSRLKEEFIEVLEFR